MNSHLTGNQGNQKILCYHGNYPDWVTGDVIPFNISLVLSGVRGGGGVFWYSYDIAYSDDKSCLCGSSSEDGLFGLELEGL